MKKTGVLALLGLLGVTIGMVALKPKKAHAADGTGGGPFDDGDQNDSQPVQPQNAQEVYALAMNPGLKDPEKVHEYALWLASSGQRPDWAAAAEARAVNLRAEQLLARGLLSSTSLADVENYARQLATASMHQAYASVLASRIAVERGAAPPAPFMLELLSGGQLKVDLSIYAPSRGGGAVAPSPVTPTPAPTGPSVTNVTPVTPTPTPGVPNAPVSPAVPPVPPVPGKPPIAAEEEKPDNDPNGTIALARLMLEEQAKAGWKYVSEAVKAWQRKVSLTPDGKFGPGSALRMATEVAVLPWIRYWPTGSASKSQAVTDYRGRLKALALSMAKQYPERVEHSAALLRCADLETGQGWPVQPKAAPATPPPPEEIAKRASDLTTELRQQSVSGRFYR